MHQLRVYEAELYRVYKDRSEVVDTKIIETSKKLDDIYIVNKLDYNLLIFITPLNGRRNTETNQDPN